ncbi:MAG: hypothetical protein K2Q22_07270 [Cytophagales bacterium]|nr:hypothetical protein [Cytophagales bacterium]
MLPETYYHVYTHANGSENLFRSEENYFYFLKRYAHFIHPVADTFAYCLMPNHVHFLIRVKSEEALIGFWNEKYPAKLIGEQKSLEVYENLQGLTPQQFSNLFNSYTKSYNKVYQRRGSLFIPNFKRKPVTNDTYFTALIHYIHANPVHQGFVKDILDWNWSSYHSLLSEKHTRLKREEVLEWFGGKDAFGSSHYKPLDRQIILEMDF